MIAHQSPIPAVEALLERIAPRAHARVRTFIDKLPQVVAAPGGHLTLLHVDDHGETQFGRWPDDDAQTAPTPRTVDAAIAWLIATIASFTAAIAADRPAKLRARGWLDGGKAHGSVTFMVTGTGSKAAVIDADRETRTQDVPSSRTGDRGEGCPTAAVTPPPAVVVQTTDPTAAERDDLRHRVAELERDLAASERARDEALATSRTLDAELLAARRDATDHTRQRDALADRLARREDELRAAQAALQEERTARRAAESALDDTRHRLASAQSDAAAQRRDNKRLTEQRRELRADLRRAAEARTADRATIDKLKAVRTRLRDKLRTERADRANAERRAANLDRQLNKSRARSAQLTGERDEWSSVARSAVRDVAEAYGYDPDEFDEFG